MAVAMPRTKLGIPSGSNSGVGPLQGPEALRGKNPQGPMGLGDGAEFKKALDQVAGNQPAARPQAALSPQGVGATDKLKFSSHAIERMRSRGIHFQPEEMQRIEGALAKAAAKGSKDSLILSGDNALIVSVKNNTVVTVMDRAAMKENVFTNIDSTVVL